MLLQNIHHLLLVLPFSLAKSKIPLLFYGWLVRRLVGLSFGWLGWVEWQISDLDLFCLRFLAFATMRSFAFCLTTLIYPSSNALVCSFAICLRGWEINVLAFFLGAKGMGSETGRNCTIV